MSASTLREEILTLVHSEANQALGKTTIARALDIPPEGRAVLRKTLDELVADGSLTLGNKNLYSARSGGKKKNQLIGTIKFQPKGHAFFFPDLADPDNQGSSIDLTIHSRIMVPRHNAAIALDGDKVLVEVGFPSPRREANGKGRVAAKPGRRDFNGGSEPIAVVTRVISRRSGQVVGIFRRSGKNSWAESDDSALDSKQITLDGDTTAEPGQLVVIEIGEWRDRSTAPRGHVTEVLGWPGDAGVDMLSIIHRYGLRTSFPDEVLAQARETPDELDSKEIKRRKDWRKKLVITIDPADAKDHDDAIWVKKSKTGWSLAVHIADVSHYVKPGSPMDLEAVERGNSTYLVDRVLPMLPTDLSNGICSLKPNVDRLTKCALLEISNEGKVEKVSFVDAVIHSRAKLSYEQAQVILDGGEAPPDSDKELAAMVRESWNLASTLRKRRFENGALDLEMPEFKIRLDDEGHAVSVDPVVHSASHQLIEECMLVANEAVARNLTDRGIPAMHRIHEDPDPSRLLDYTQTAKLHGYKPGDLTNRAHIQKLLDASKGTPEEHVIRLGLLKSLKRAAYSAEPYGHYGLAKTAYCHFTSPIRRYADLIVHRSLQRILENPPKQFDANPSQAEMRERARHFSESERTSSDAETESKQLKMFEYLAWVLGQDSAKEFDGLITDVRPMGLMVEIPTIGVRGVVKREDLPQGRWRFEAHRMAWTDSGGRELGLGMKVPLRILAVDAERRFVDFKVAGEPSRGGKPSSNSTKQTKPTKPGKSDNYSKPANRTTTRPGRSDGKSSDARNRSDKFERAEKSDRSGNSERPARQEPATQPQALRHRESAEAPFAKKSRYSHDVISTPPIPPPVKKHKDRIPVNKVRKALDTDPAKPPSRRKRRR